MLRRLVAHVDKGSTALGRPCGRCGAIIADGPKIEMRRPGKSRGVVWCSECAAPYQEEP